MGRRGRADLPKEGTTTRTVHLDAEGQPTADPASAVRGEIVDYDSGGQPTRRISFLVRDSNIEWLPVSEPAFLLWVLVLLALVWAVIGLVLRFFLF